MVQDRLRSIKPLSCSRWRPRSRTGTARTGDDLTKVATDVDEELAGRLLSGPTQDELDRVRTQYFAWFVRGAERIGGFGGKSDSLAQSPVFGGSPDDYKKALNFVA